MNTDGTQKKRYVGELCDGFDESLLDFSRTAFLKSADYVTDVLQKLVVLDTALIGGFLAMKEMPISHTIRIIAIGLFLVSLVLAFCGIYPRDLKFRQDRLDQIESGYSAIVKSKSRLFKYASLLLFLGLATGFGGIVIGNRTPDPQPIPYAVDLACQSK